jgi:hypothetical protein
MNERALVEDRIVNVCAIQKGKMKRKKGLNVSMNCGHTVGTLESGNKSAGWLVPALRLWERRAATWARGAGIVEGDVAVSVESH